MPAVDTVLLPLCVGLTLLGIIATGIAWRRGNKGRVVQGVGLALAPVALYFSGLLRLLWNGIVAVGTWASTLIFSPAIWFGMALLGLCVVLWVVGGMVARRSAPRTKGAKATSGQAATAALPAKSKAGRAPARNQPEVDPELAEIEALLKSRGIE
ncbi:MAG TPA: hypothetical protein VE476_03325 [Propionibacteriaceae bacterium]|nr:hypothetical protein [Propionibacteriaceae bacterium]